MASASFPILLVAPERVDDAILGSGLVRRLLDEIPHARFTVLCSDAVAPLFRDLPELDRTLLITPARFGLHWLGLWGRLRGRRWGLILDLRGTPLPGFLPARRRAVKRPVNPALEPVHKVRELARVLKIDISEALKASGPTGIGPLQSSGRFRTRTGGLSGSRIQYAWPSSRSVEARTFREPGKNTADVER